MTATATVLHPYVRVSTNLDEAVTWTRVDTGAESGSALAAATIGTGTVVRDAMPPLGRLVYYTNSAGETTNTVLVSSSQPILYNPVTGEHLALTVVSQPPTTWVGRSTWYPILDRIDPVSVTGKPLYGRGDLVVHLPGRGARAKLQRLLFDGSPLVLRTPCPYAVDDMVFVVEQWSDELVSAAAPSGPRLVSITYQAVAEAVATLGLHASHWTYWHVAESRATYDTVKGEFASYAALRTGPAMDAHGVEIRS